MRRRKNEGYKRVKKFIPVPVSNIFLGDHKGNVKLYHKLCCPHCGKKLFHNIKTLFCKSEDCNFNGDLVVYDRLVINFLDILCQKTKVGKLSNNGSFTINW